MKSNLLQDTTRAGLYHLPVSCQDNLPDLVSKAHQVMLSADLGGCNDRHETLRELGKAFHFPTWYGENFDALHDCLSDPDWQPGRGIVLQIAGLDTLRSIDPEAFSILIDVLRSATAARSAGQPPLWILLSSPVPGVANLPDA